MLEHSPSNAAAVAVAVGLSQHFGSQPEVGIVDSDARSKNGMIENGSGLTAEFLEVG